MQKREGGIQTSGFHERLNYAGNFIESLCPAVFLYTCTQCDSTTYALLLNVAGGQILSVHPSEHGGLRSPNTPSSVAFYLDQAMRSVQAGARSAAATMYRSALEMLLFQQGFKNGLLHQKIIDLVVAIDGKTAPLWANDLDTDFLELLKQIGNGSVHTNGGDITKQQVIDEDLLRNIGVIIKGLLGLVYEIPLKKLSLKAQLQDAAAILKK
jgi:hypothetical protein